jgi:hypothetical protein
VQVTYTGSYDEEDATLKKLEKFVKESGYIFDITGDSIKTLSRRHNEIYLSNPCKVALEKMIKTGMPKLLAWLLPVK